MRRRSFLTACAAPFAVGCIGSEVTTETVVERLDVDEGTRATAVVADGVVSVSSSEGDQVVVEAGKRTTEGDAGIDEIEVVTDASDGERHRHRRLSRHRRLRREIRRRPRPRVA